MATKNTVTQAQYDMLRSLKSGNTVAEAADALGISAATARSRASTLMSKNLISVKGTRKSGTRGRPAATYSVSTDLRTIRPRG